MQSSSVSDPQTAMMNTVQPRDLVTTFNYSPRTIEQGPPDPIAVHLGTKLDESLPVEAVVHDIRGTEDQFSLDTTGFQIVKHASSESEFVDDDRIEKVYYPEIEVLFRNVTGASHVKIYSHVIRRQAFDYLNKTATAARACSTIPSDAPTRSVPKSLRGPLHTVHIDHSYAGASMLLHQQFPPSEIPKLLAGRYQILVAWRPIKTILRDPFAVCDARSVLEEELVPIKLIYPNREAETFSVRPALEGREDGGHRWCYLHRQSPEEVLVFKIFDSEVEGGVARRVAHSAFVDKEYAGEEPRESLEVRAFVFYDE